MPPKNKRRQRERSPQEADWGDRTDSEGEHDYDGESQYESESSMQSRPRSSCSEDAVTRILGCSSSTVVRAVDAPEEAQINVPEVRQKGLSEEERREIGGN